MAVKIPDGCISNRESKFSTTSKRRANLAPAQAGPLESITKWPEIVFSEPAVGDVSSLPGFAALIDCVPRNSGRPQAPLSQFFPLNRKIWIAVTPATESLVPGGLMSHKLHQRSRPAMALPQGRRTNFLIVIEEYACSRLEKLSERKPMFRAE